MMDKCNVILAQAFFNISNRASIENEVKLLEKGLLLANIQRKINKPEFRKNFQ